MELVVCGVAATADEAVRLATTLLPDIVLMDVRLEGPRDGVAAAIEIEQLTQAPVIFITGSREPETLVRIAQDHPAGLLFKPFRFDQLKTAVTKAIG